MATTPNYNWPLIEPTDFVTNLPADFQDFADAVDTTVYDIQTKLDVITTEGDLIIGDASGDPVALSIGAAGTVLTSDGDTADWAAPAAAAENYTLLNTGGTALTGASTITVSGISNKDKIMVLIEGASAGAGALMSIRFNGDSGNNYRQYGMVIDANNTYAATNFSTSGIFGTPPIATIYIGSLSSNANSVCNGYLKVNGCNSSGVKVFTGSSGSTAATGTGHRLIETGGIWNNSATVSSVSIRSDTGNFDAGTIFVYTSA